MKHTKKKIYYLFWKLKTLQPLRAYLNSDELKNKLIHADFLKKLHATLGSAFLS
jgi:hypothetical protein